MTLVEIEDTLPWGLHDAYLEEMAIDWPNRRLILTVRVMISERQDRDQRARVTVDGLAFCVVDPPQRMPEAEETAHGLWIDSGTGAAPRRAGPPLPEAPPGCFVHCFFVHPWNAFIHVCGERARLDWLETTPMPARADTRALFAGDEVPD
jgi:hypothetical protein